MNEQQSLDFLDLLTVLSFWLQLQNQNKIFGIKDVQYDSNRIANELHEHLEKQDEKINKILEALNERKNRNV